MKIVGFNLALMVLTALAVTLALDLNGYNSVTDHSLAGIAIGILFGMLGLSPFKFEGPK
jgi:hypothetical protein